MEGLGAGAGSDAAAPTVDGFATCNFCKFDAATYRFKCSRCNWLVACSECSKGVVRCIYCRTVLPQDDQRTLSDQPTLLETLPGAASVAGDEPADLPAAPAASSGSAQQRRTPRPYQQAAFEHIKGQNTIVNLETGLGKTLIAVMCCDYFHEREPLKKILFCVTTVQLAEQQAKTLRDSTAKPLRVVDLTGKKCKVLSEEWWKLALDAYDVFVGIGQTLKKALVDCAFIRAEQLSLVILDECHYAIGNDPFVSLIQDGLPRDGGPRILGLTASYLHGRGNSDFVKKRINLEKILNSSIWCADEEETKPFLTTQTFSSIQFPIGSPGYLMLRETCCDELQKRMKPLIGGHLKHMAKDLKKHLEKAEHIFGQSGLWGWQTYVTELVRRIIEETSDELPGLEKFIDACSKLLAEERDACSGKQLALFSLLDSFGEVVGSDNFRCIIFVEQVADVFPLSHAINRHFRRDSLALHISGTSSMTAAVQRVHLTKFKNGECSVLVATKSMEEGIDVPTCNVVVRYDEFHNVKSHVQGAGRARMKDANIFYFENDPEEEKRVAEMMKQAARGELMPTEPGFVSSEIGRLRHPTTEAELDIFNCLEILRDYVQRTMGASSLSPFIWSLVGKDKPPNILKCQLPTPSGPLYVDEAQVAAFWKQKSNNLDEPEPSDFLQHLDRTRSANWGNKEIAEHRSAYVAVIELIHRGHITDRNMPSFEALANCRSHCESLLRDHDERHSLRVVFGNVLPSASASGNGNIAFDLSGGGVASSSKSTEARPRVRLASDKPVVAFDSNGNYRGQLNTLLAKYLGRPVTQGDVLKTSKESTPGLWCVTLMFGDLDGKSGAHESFTAECKSKVKDGEQAASALALQRLQDICRDSGGDETTSDSLGPSPHLDIQNDRNPKGKLFELLQKKFKRSLDASEIQYKSFPVEGCPVRHKVELRLPCFGPETIVVTTGPFPRIIDAEQEASRQALWKLTQGPDQMAESTMPLSSSAMRGSPPTATFEPMAQVCLVNPAGQERSVAVSLHTTVAELLDKHRPKGLATAAVEVVIGGVVAGEELKLGSFFEASGLREPLRVEIRQKEDVDW